MKEENQHLLETILIIIVSECDPVNSYVAVSGSFGYAGKTEPVYVSTGPDNGAYGGGGYYGGTSYQYAFAGSGGSSFISGYEGCKSVKEQTESIEHTNTSYHYSGIVFTDTKMIRGNATMPVPYDVTSEGIHSEEGAFRLTLLLYSSQCTYKRSLFSTLIPNLFLFVCFPINIS